MPLKSRNHFPPGGFKYRQAETGWQAPEWLSFNDLVSAVIQHRKANSRFNLPTDREVVEKQVDYYNSERLRSIKGGADYLAGEDSPPVFPQPLRRTAGAGAVAAVKNSAAGIGAVMEWLGDGLEPVPSDLAESRAAVCASCPANQLGNFWQRMQGKAADSIRALVETKNDMELRTALDGRLHVCQICDCVLTLKVHVPIEHIKKHTSDDVLNRLEPFCWVRKEISA